MTLVITLAVSNGIVMSADRQLSSFDPKTKKLKTAHRRCEKIFAPKCNDQFKFAVSIWGLIEIPLKNGKRQMLDANFFDEFAAQTTPNDTVDDISEKLRDHLNNIVDIKELKKISPVGIHLAGYDNVHGAYLARVRHICLSPNDNKDPNQKDPNLFKSNNESQYSDEPPFAMVFNGFYYICNALVNFVHQTYGSNYALFTPSKISIKKAASLTEYLMNITIGFQNYTKMSPVVGGRVNTLLITPGKGIAGRFLAR